MNKEPSFNEINDTYFATQLKKEKLEADINTILLILNSSSYTDKEKEMLLEMLSLIRTTTPEERVNYEEKAYHLKDKKLTQKEMLIYELNVLYKKVGNKKFDFDNVEDLESLAEIKRIAYLISRKASSKLEINYIKKQLTYLQIKYGLTPRFYSIFQEVIAEVITSIEKEQNKEEELIPNKRI